MFYYLSVALTLILAFITLGGALVGSVSSNSLALLPFIGLALPLLLLLNLAVALYWALRWRYWAFVSLIAIVGNWGYLSCIFQPGSQPESIPADVLTIASYNVDSFGWDPYGHSCQQVADYMKNQQADILCLQEFGTVYDFPLDSVKARLSNWPHSLIPYTADSLPLLQLAVFSKYPIKASRLITYPESKNCSMWCDIDVKGKTIRVFNNHLQTTEASRNKRKLETVMRQDEGGYGTEVAAIRLLNGLKENFGKRALQAKTLRGFIDASPYPTLVCGDFNSLPSSYAYHTVMGKRLKDGFKTCGHGYMYTFRYFKHLLRIDYVLHSKELKGVDYFSPELEYSDHNPVIMRVKFIAE